MDNNLFNFPTPPSQEPEDHKCDGCASVMIHEITHRNFEEFDIGETVQMYLEDIFEAVSEDDQDGLISIVIEMFNEAYEMGCKNVLKNELMRMSGMLATMTNEAADEEQ